MFRHDAISTTMLLRHKCRVVLCQVTAPAMPCRMRGAVVCRQSRFSAPCALLDAKRDYCHEDAIRAYACCRRSPMPLAYAIFARRL